MGKIKTIKEIVKITKKEKKKGKTVGLITGCFDLLHLGHIDLFKFSKKNVDIVVVGIDSNKTLELSKGTGRPIYNQKQRMSFLAAIEAINYVFPIRANFKHGSKISKNYYPQLYKKIKPNFLITNIKADKWYKKKKDDAKKIGIGFIGEIRNKKTSTSDILKYLEKRL